MSGGGLSYDFTQPAGVSGITYGAQWSATMQAGDWHAIPDTGNGGRHIFNAPSGTRAQLYLRLVVSDP